MEPFIKDIARQQGYFTLMAWRIAAAHRIYRRHGLMVAAYIASMPFCPDMQVDPEYAGKIVRKTVQGRRLIKIFCFMEN